MELLRTRLADTKDKLLRVDMTYQTLADQNQSLTENLLAQKKEVAEFQKKI